MNKALFSILALVISGCAALAQERPEIPAIPESLEQPPQRPGLEIFAQLMEADLKTRAILYSNKVVAIDQPLKPGEPATIVRCRTLMRTNDGQFDRIIAEGDVEIDQGDIHARGQRAEYSSETERLELTGPYGEFPRPMLYSTQSTNANSTVITNLGEKITYDRRNGKLTIEKPQTWVPASSLSRGTNSANPFDLRPRPVPATPQTNEGVTPPGSTNRALFSTQPTRPLRPVERKGAL